MKVRTLKDCERELREEVAKKNFEAQYNMYALSCDTMFRAAAATVVATFFRKERSKRYVQDWFNEFVNILEMPSAFGVEITSNDLIAKFEELYGIDFSKIKVNCESKEEFYRRYRKNLK